MTDLLTPEFTENDMAALWQTVAQMAQDYRRDLPGLPVAPVLDPGALRGALAAFDFDARRPWQDVLVWVDDRMRGDQLHTGHPRYFGLFNPAPVPLGVAADALVAAYNPQLAAWSHSPFAAEVERHLIRAFAMRFGFEEASADGTFCSGGAEANHTALLCALATRFPGFAEHGVRALPGDPVLYVSVHAHHSWVKAARACGLGGEAVRFIAAGPGHRMDVNALALQIVEDRARGAMPVLVCGTAGTTNGGIIDDLEAIGRLCRTEKLWHHVDAAWGGAACFVPEYRAWLKGVEAADSITFDAHKFLSVPMGGGVFLTRHPAALDRAFRIETSYMPRDACELDVSDPYAHSLQWSRRFIGLKIFLPLAAAGWEGYAALIRKQTELGYRLRMFLEADGWTVVNQTPLPIVCFTDGGLQNPKSLLRIAEAVVASGAAWISPASLGKTVLRACITNFRTEESDLHALVAALREARVAETAS